MGASVVAGVDAPPVFELAEHVLDFVTTFVERLIERDSVLRLDLRGMQGAIA